MKNKISIIVPTYNVEKYIAKCLDSLVNQDYDNYDVLVINDGSPANEQVIIDEYVKKYPKIIKSIIKENGGYGSVLQLGIQESDSEYILVCDPDDYLDSKALSTLHNLMITNDVDLVVGAKNLVYSDNEEVKYDKSYNSEFGTLKENHVYDSNKNEYEILYFFEPSPHAKLYKREVIKNIKFPTKVSYTDNLLYFYTLANVNKVIYCNIALSYYLIDREGNTRTDLNPKIIDAWTTVFKSIINQVNNANDIFYYRMFESFYSIFYKVDLIKGDNQEKQYKYQLVYSYLDTLSPYKDKILKLNNIYNNDNNIIKHQKEKLLTSSDSLKMFNNLVNNRLNKSIKQRIKTKIINNSLLSKIYDKYHFHAKYYKTRNDKKIILNKDVSINVIDNNSTNFFGYYDKPCIRNNKALYHRVNTISLKYNQTIDIMVDDKKVSETNTWNWQQGAMSTWLDDDHIIHNFYDGKDYKSKIVNINDNTFKLIDFPIYTVSEDKTFSLRLSFDRLAKLRPDYGYFNSDLSLKSNHEDGIFYIDLSDNTYKLFMSLDEILSFNNEKTMLNAIHKVNHIEIAKDNKKAIFLHRWYLDDVKYTRLLLLDINSKELKVLANNGMVSHMCFYNDDTLFGYLKGNNGKDGYFFIDYNGNQKQFVHPLLVDDGHPTVINSRYIVTDTYPDYTCKSKLLLIDLENNNVIKIGEFYSGKVYQGQLRCDLHPRVNYNNNSVTIDTVFNGKRQVIEVNLKNIL